MKISTKFIIPAVALVSFCLPQQSRAGAQKVIVNNGVSNPVPVNVQNQIATHSTDNPALQPYEQGGQILFGDTANGGSIYFDVPAGKRLVIESVTVTGELPVGQKLLEAAFLTTNNSLQVDHFLVVHAEGHDSIFGKDIFTASQLTRGYSDAGTGSVRVDARRDTLGTGANAVVSVTGYLVNVP